MMLTKCYCVVYHVANFAADGEFICHQDTYRDHNNALLVAKDLAKCFDVVDDVYVIDGLTGEVLNTILKDEPQKDTTEEDDTPVFTEEFDDGTGGMWRRANDDKWEYDCTGFGCSDCAYCGANQLCMVRRSTTTEDRDAQIKSAKERMCAKANKAEEKENSTSSDIFDDGIGGVWKLAKNNTWSYNCKGLDCLDCAYYDEGHCSASGHVTKEERDILIKFAKAGMKK